MDDLNSCIDEVNDGINFYWWCKSILKEGGFNLRKFDLNSKVLEDIFCESDFTPKPETKVLGVSWDKQINILIFYFKDLMKMADDIRNKKEVLKFVASIYNPLGLINPVVVKLKVLFQNLSVSKLSWEDYLDGENLTEWQSILNDFLSSSNVMVPRWYLNSSNFLPNYKLELHCFSNASNKAYGCCIYIRIFDETHSCSTLIASKLRVASLSKTTIPRLELSAILLLAELMINV
ncbi:uncharacterized protein LOC136074547 [Hydra vulgaris]|uniref:Uncharacterized protein LOC136074547 n=1 Tax=Hydra vulgaris TaxID=6087 RepID=A0ABM4B2D5_HYDVU